MGYATLGLSRHLLVSAVPTQSVREEFLMLAPKAVDPHLIAGLLHQVASRALEAHHAYRYGDVLGPANALVPGSDLTALYVAMPNYFPDEFATFTDEDGDIDIAWLVPITTGEAHFVRHHGWHKFEDVLAEQDPDVIDFHRSEVKL